MSVSTNLGTGGAMQDEESACAAIVSMTSVECVHHLTLSLNKSSRVPVLAMMDRSV